MAEAVSESDFHATLIKHDKDIELLGRDVKGIRREMGEVVNATKSTQDAVQQLAGSIAVQGRPSLDNIRTIIGIVQSTAVSVGLFVAAIVYVASEHTEPRFVVLEYKVNALEKLSALNTKVQ